MFSNNIFVISYPKLNIPFTRDSNRTKRWKFWNILTSSVNCLAEAATRTNHFFQFKTYPFPWEIIFQDHLFMGELKRRLAINYCSCMLFCRVFKYAELFRLFIQQLIYPSSTQIPVDVYLPMFLCDLVNLCLLLFFFESFEVSYLNLKTTQIFLKLNFRATQIKWAFWTSPKSIEYPLHL